MSTSYTFTFAPKRVPNPSKLKPLILSYKATHMVPTCPLQREIYWHIVNKLDCDPLPTSTHPHLGELIQNTVEESSARPKTLLHAWIILDSVERVENCAGAGQDIFLYAFNKANNRLDQSTLKSLKLSSKAKHAAVPAHPQQRNIYWHIVNNLGCNPEPTSTLPHLGELIQKTVEMTSATPNTLLYTLVVLVSVEMVENCAGAGQHIFLQAFHIAHQRSSSEDSSEQLISRTRSAHNEDRNERRTSPLRTPSVQSKSNENQPIKDEETKHGWLISSIAWIPLAIFLAFQLN